MSLNEQSKNFDGEMGPTRKVDMDYGWLSTNSNYRDGVGKQDKYLWKFGGKGFHSSYFCPKYNQLGDNKSLPNKEIKEFRDLIFKLAGNPSGPSFTGAKTMQYNDFIVKGLQKYRDTVVPTKNWDDNQKKYTKTMLNNFINYIDGKEYGTLCDYTSVEDIIGHSHELIYENRHEILDIAAIVFAFIPGGIVISGVIELANGALYIKEGDPVTGGISIIFAFLPFLNKIPGFEKVSTKIMLPIIEKLRKGQELTKQQFTFLQKFINDLITHKKLITDKIGFLKKQKEIFLENGGTEELYSKYLKEVLEGKKTKEEFFSLLKGSVKKPPIKKIGVVKIAKEKIEEIKNVFKQKGWDDVWGYDGETGDPNFIETIMNIDGVETKVKLTVSDYGPHRLKGKGLERYDLKAQNAAGVRLTDDEGVDWVILRPGSHKTFDDILFSLEHELVHIKQPSKMSNKLSSSYVTDTEIKNMNFGNVVKTLSKYPKHVKLNHFKRAIYTEALKKFAKISKYEDDFIKKFVAEEDKVMFRENYDLWFKEKGSKIDNPWLKTMFDELKEVDSRYTDYNQFYKNLLNKSEEEVDKVFKIYLNSTDKSHQSIVRDILHNVGYTEHQWEIEANLSPFISNLIDYAKKSIKPEQGEITSTFIKDMKKWLKSLGTNNDYNAARTLRDYHVSDSFYREMLNYGKLFDTDPEKGKKVVNKIYKQLENLKTSGLKESMKPKKIIINQHQKGLLTEFKKRAYSFDWDDNILFMPTKIYLEKKVGDGWIPVLVGTEEFREIRNRVGKDYRYEKDDLYYAFKDFRDYDAFIRDTKEALRKKSFGPSFDKFKEALLYGNDFSIITARGNPPKAIKDGIKVIIDTLFTEEQKEKMLSNLHGTSIEQYLNLQDYYPVTSDEFVEEFDTDVSVTNPEVGKMIALKTFVDRVVSAVKEIKDNPEYNGMSIGFSDDDLGNIESAEKYIEEKLKKIYPDVKFLVYDTSDPNNPKKKRIIIKK